MADAPARDPGRGAGAHPGWWRGFGAQPMSGKPMPSVSPGTLPLWDVESDRAWLPLPARARRRYRLSAAGLDSLRAHAFRVKPWTHSTGPKTMEGIDACRRNANKGCGRSMLWKARDRAAAAMLRAMDAELEVLDLVAMLARQWGVGLWAAAEWIDDPAFDGGPPAYIANR
ncbi:MAG: hypothetical protein JSS51_07395 [Planctomycetes bacterium]|nr:hypothetical protein [Planctomycetota bacterium]